MRRPGTRATWWCVPVGATSLLGISLLLLSVPVPAPAQDRPYTVQCEAGATSGADCQVDKKTYIGWRTYHAFCHVCHAQDAVGSTFAPSLVERLKDIDKARYLNSVNEGYTGQVGVMPGWKENPNVNSRYEELYAYLMARADGVLPPGRPERAK